MAIAASALPAPSEPASADAGPSAAGSADELAKAKARLVELERNIGRQQAELHFFREPCGSGTHAPTRRRGDLYAVIQAMTAGEPQGYCEKDANSAAVRAERRSARRLLPALAPKASKRDDAELRDVIQRIALDHRHYGYRRIASALARGLAPTPSGSCG